jgi:predicted aconitase
MDAALEAHALARFLCWNSNIMMLSSEERVVLEGSRGEILQRVMATVVAYGQALDAERLVAITGRGHLVIPHALPGIAPSMQMLDALIAGDLKTSHPFTLDPMAPLDCENWWLDAEQIASLKHMYRNQSAYDEKMLALGLWHSEAWTCTPYLPEVGNTPERGDILAWSESACVAFANSVLGARSNRNGAIVDLLCNIAGKIPLSGLLTDEGRMAHWRIDVATQHLPPPQILGAAIGKIVQADVPYVTGLDRFLGYDLDSATKDYLHELGAAAAAAGAVGLFHVENVTPEAVDHERDLLTDGCAHAAIDDAHLRDLLASYPVLWRDRHATPDKCFLGCPHLSPRQLAWWATEIRRRLEAHGRTHLKVHTTISAAPQVLRKFIEKREGWEALSAAGVRFSTACPMQLFDNELSREDAIITNSNKLRTYTHARFVPDEEIADILVTGRIERGK